MNEKTKTYELVESDESPKGVSILFLKCDCGEFLSVEDFSSVSFDDKDGHLVNRIRLRSVKCKCGERIIARIKGRVVFDSKYWMTAADNDKAEEVEA